MLNRHEARFNEREWACMSVQAPLGTVILARKLPVIAPPMRASGATIVWSNRRFAPSNPPDSTVKKPRSRRGL
jgi:hypothetical protein